MPFSAAGDTSAGLCLLHEKGNASQGHVSGHCIHLGAQLVLGDGDYSGDGDSNNNKDYT